MSKWSGTHFHMTVIFNTVSYYKLAPHNCIYKLKVAGLFAQFHESFLYLGATSGNFSISKKSPQAPPKRRSLYCQYLSKMSIKGCLLCVANWWVTLSKLKMQKLFTPRAHVPKNRDSNTRIYKQIKCVWARVPKFEKMSGASLGTLTHAVTLALKQQWVFM